MWDKRFSDQQLKVELGETIVSNISSNLGKVVSEAYLYKKQTGAESWLGVERELGWGDAGAQNCPWDRTEQSFVPWPQGCLGATLKNLRGNAGRVQSPGGCKTAKLQHLFIFFPPSPMNWNRWSLHRVIKMFCTVYFTACLYLPLCCCYLL